MRSVTYTFDTYNLVNLIKISLADDKAEDIIVVDLSGKALFADYMVIATGNSARQVKAMAEHLHKQLKACGMLVGLEGAHECEWVLLDVGDVVVHLFMPETRSFYKIEKMWGVSAGSESATTLQSQDR